MESMRRHREVLKSGFATMPAGLASDQRKGLPQPPIQKPLPPGIKPIALPPPGSAAAVKPDLRACIGDRRSRRSFADTPLTLPQLSFLLWATQGVREVLDGGYATLRTVPSAGARHLLETYLIVHRVQGLIAGIYRYLPLGHQVALIAGPGHLPAKTAAAALGQRFAGDCAAVFVWSAVPCRGEWRYLQDAHKLILLDAGHVAQNLYLACEALGLGACAIAAYDQDAFDTLIGLDGQDEMVVYLAPVGVL
jgi:SagB-type dehydrogenase family enzyme